jgi:PAS domain S-box-containing protein
MDHCGDHYQALFDKLADAFSYRKVITDQTGRPVDLEYITVNPAYERLFGLRACEIVGKRFTEVFYGCDETVSDWMESIGEVAATGQAATFEQYHRTSGRWYRFSAYSSRPGYVATIAQDITDRKRAEEALRESELKYRLLFENVNDAIRLVKIEADSAMGRIHEVNKVACHMLGYAREELIGLPVREIDPALTSEEWEKYTAQLKVAGSCIYKRTHKAKDGTLIPVEIRAKYLTLGGAEFSLTVDLDLRERTRTEKILKTSYERMRRNHFLNRLINTTDRPQQMVQEMILTTGLNLPDIFSCFLVVLETWRGKPTDYWQQHPFEQYQLMNAIIESLEDDGNLIAWASPLGVGVIHTCPGSHGDEKASQMEIAHNLRKLIDKNVPDLTFKIGTAPLTEQVTDLGGRYRQCQIAVDAGREIWPEREIHHYLDMGILQVLPFIDRAEASAYVERTLGRLLNYEKKKKGEFLMTLEVLLESNTLAEAAKKLFVHPKTLEFRRRRIEQILNVSLDSNNTRTTLQVALMLRKITEKRA